MSIPRPFGNVRRFFDRRRKRNQAVGPGKLKKLNPVRKQGRMPKDQKTRETKFIEASSGLTSAIYTGAFLLCNGLTQGTTASQRIGNRIHLNKMHVRMTVKSSQAVADVLANLRVIILYDKESNGALPAANNQGSYATGGINGVLDTAGTTTAANMNILEQYVQSNADRFVILYDKTTPIPLVETGVALVINSLHFFEIKKKLNSFTTYVGTGGGTIASIAEGALYVFYMSDQLNAANNAPYVNITSRVYYTDD